jgi:hypothetical protein
MNGTLSGEGVSLFSFFHHPKSATLMVKLACAPLHRDDLMTVEYESSRVIQRQLSWLFNFKEVLHRTPNLIPLVLANVRDACNDVACLVNAYRERTAEAESTAQEIVGRLKARDNPLRRRVVQFAPSIPPAPPGRSPALLPRPETPSPHSCSLADSVFKHQ